MYSLRYLGVVKNYNTQYNILQYVVMFTYFVSMYDVVSIEKFCNITQNFSFTVLRSISSYCKNISSFGTYRFISLYVYVPF